MSNQGRKKAELMEERVYYMYRKIGDELTEELSTLGKLTDLIQYFKDNNIVALRRIYEGDREGISGELKSNVS